MAWNSLGSIPKTPLPTTQSKCFSFNVRRGQQRDPIYQCLFNTVVGVLKKLKKKKEKVSVYV